MSVISNISRWQLFVACAILLFFSAIPTYGQFSSGSTGADGAFSPSSSQTITLPTSGVYNYTTYNIPAGVTITYARNAANTPVTILCSGNVTISGTIIIDGQNYNSNTFGLGALGGPGGFNGGHAGYPADSTTLNGGAGDGPGGGSPGSGSTTTNYGYGGGAGFRVAGTTGSATGTGTGGQGGDRYSSAYLLPLIGGSGGGGDGSSSGSISGGGGGGGGAILIASSGTITLASGSGIYSRGGAPGGSAGGGSGGAIRLIANTITGTNPVFNVNGSTRASSGYIRLEAYSFTSFTSQPSPTASLTLGLPGPITLASPPILKIASIAGVSTPSTTNGKFTAATDMTLASTTSNPMTVVVEGTRVPVGTLVQVTVIPEYGSRTSVQTSALSGTYTSSTGSASVSLPAGLSVLTASATVELVSSADIPPMFLDGERVERVEITANYGGGSDAIYITKSGKRIPASSLQQVK